MINIARKVAQGGFFFLKGKFKKEKEYAVMIYGVEL